MSSSFPSENSTSQIVLPLQLGTKYQLRDYQIECLMAVEGGERKFSRQLIVLCTGAGKTILFSLVAKRFVESGRKVLILVHTDELKQQAADKLFRATGIRAEIEKADEYASPSAMVVVASIQTISRESRLMGFRDDHFGLVIQDEAHRSLAKSHLKVLNYFHYGAASLGKDWAPPPKDMPHAFKARILGVTATADRGDKRSLGEFYEGPVDSTGRVSPTFECGLLELVREGYLVRPLVRNIPIKIDLRGVKKIAGDYSAEDLALRITPFLKAIAAAIKVEAGDRKTVVFTPSIETARLLAEALVEIGMDARFVSGACDDRDAKIKTFERAPKGSIITCAMLLVEGWDCDSADCICVLRPTKIRSLFVQAVGRGTRTLTGLIDGLESAESRLEAIRNSAKKNVLILDFLWLSDKLDLIKPVDLMTIDPALREKLLERPELDLVEAEAAAQRDLLASLEKAARKHSRKAARTIDPLAIAVGIGVDLKASYEPETPWDSLAPDQSQIEALERHGIDASRVSTRGHASKLLDRLVSRSQMGLATPRQMNFLMRMGIPEAEVALMSKGKAGLLISRPNALFSMRRFSTKKPA